MPINAEPKLWDRSGRQHGKSSGKIRPKNLLLGAGVTWGLAQCPFPSERTQPTYIFPWLSQKKARPLSQEHGLKLSKREIH